jgi:hypothetical protein
MNHKIVHRPGRPTKLGQLGEILLGIATQSVLQWNEQPPRHEEMETNHEEKEIVGICDV